MKKNRNKFTFTDIDGKFPVSDNGQVQWVRNKKELIKLAKSYGANKLVELGENGKIISTSNIKY
jgi:hypothetical protein